jgi:hypothetical protein
MTKPNKYCSNKDWLYDQYIVQKKSATKIAKEIGCQQETVSRYLHKFEIPIRTQSEEIGGDRHPMFGKHFSDDSKKKMSIANTGHKSSDETRKKISKATSGSNNPRYGKKATPEQRQKQSESMKRFYNENPDVKITISKQKIEYNKQHPEAGQQHSEHLKQLYKEHPEILEQMSKTHKQRYIDQPLTIEDKEERASHLKKFYEEHPEARTEHSKLMKVCNPSSRPEVAQKISDSMKIWHLENASPVGTGSVPGRYFLRKTGETVWMRSSYETRYAKILDLFDINWEYEIHAFNITTIGTSYRPDFYIAETNTWIEVKGYLSWSNKEKLIEFHKLYPNENLILVYLKQIEELEKKEMLNNYSLDDIYVYCIPIKEQVILWEEEKLELDKLKLEKQQ